MPSNLMEVELMDSSLLTRPSNTNCTLIILYNGFMLKYGLSENGVYYAWIWL